MLQKCGLKNPPHPIHTIVNSDGTTRASKRDLGRYIKDCKKVSQNQKDTSDTIINNCNVMGGKNLRNNKSYYMQTKRKYKKHRKSRRKHRKSRRKHKRGRGSGESFKKGTIKKYLKK